VNAPQRGAEVATDQSGAGPADASPTGRSGTTLAWWHCASGIAGDMALASLVDAGAGLDEVISGLRSLPLSGWEISATAVTRAGLAATYLRVEVAERPAEPRPWPVVRDLVQSAGNIPARAQRRALDVFAALAAAEARRHAVPLEQVHFHEVGSTDAILDVVGTCLALELLGVDEVCASPVALGLGTLSSSHGPLPNPAPAVLALLSGAPVYGTSFPVELTTPTGAALLVGLGASFGPLPEVVVAASGYGAGTADLPAMANVLQVVIGHAPAVLAAGREHLAVLETNVDDVTGEMLAHTVTSLLSAGALDAWVTPVIAKKGRPAHVVSALCPPSLGPALVELLAVTTGTLGVRQYTVERWAMPRRTVEVDVGGCTVRVKAGPYRFKAEYEDCAATSARLGVGAAEVARRAEAAAAALVDAPVQ